MGKFYRYIWSKIVDHAFSCRLIVSATQQCSTQITATPHTKCPAGSEIVGELCIKQEMTAPIASCPPGSRAAGPGMCMGGKGPVPKSKDCPPGFGFHDKGNCERRTTLKLETVCPPGFGLEGTICTATDFANPTPVCPQGTTTVGDQCVGKETYVPTKQCPPTLTLDDVSMMCVGEASAPQSYACPLGTFDPLERACVLAEVTPTEVGCPPNAKPTSNDTGALICEERVTAAPRILCPPDFSVAEGNTSCLGRAVSEGELTCMAPYTDNGVECTYTEILPKTIGCKDGGFLKGTSCISSDSQPPVVMCPEAYIYSADSQLCRKLLWSKPTAICPPRYIFDNLVQKCYRFGSEEDFNQTQPASPEEDLLPLEAQAPTAPEQPRNPVKAKISPPSAGKEQFIPIQTFRGQDAVQQAENMETMKLINGATHSADTGPSAVRVPPI